MKRLQCHLRRFGDVRHEDVKTVVLIGKGGVIHRHDGAGIAEVVITGIS